MMTQSKTSSTGQIEYPSSWKNFFEEVQRGINSEQPSRVTVSEYIENIAKEFSRNRQSSDSRFTASSIWFYRELYKRSYEEINKKSDKSSKELEEHDYYIFASTVIEVLKNKFPFDYFLFNFELKNNISSEDIAEIDKFSSGYRSVNNWETFITKVVTYLTKANKADLANSLSQDFEKQKLSLLDKVQNRGQKKVGHFSESSNNDPMPIEHTQLPPMPVGNTQSQILTDEYYKILMNKAAYNFYNEKGCKQSTSTSKLQKLGNNSELVNYLCFSPPADSNQHEEFITKIKEKLDKLIFTRNNILIRHDKTWYSLFENKLYEQVIKSETLKIGVKNLELDKNTIIIVGGTAVNIAKKILDVKTSTKKRKISSEFPKNLTLKMRKKRFSGKDYENLKGVREDEEYVSEDEEYVPEDEDSSYEIEEGQQSNSFSQNENEDEDEDEEEPAPEENLYKVSGSESEDKEIIKDDEEDDSQDDEGKGQEISGKNQNKLTNISISDEESTSKSDENAENIRHASNNNDYGNNSRDEALLLTSKKTAKPATMIEEDNEIYENSSDIETNASIIKSINALQQENCVYEFKNEQLLSSMSLHQQKITDDLNESTEIQLDMLEKSKELLQKTIKELQIATNRYLEQKNTFIKCRSAIGEIYDSQNNSYLEEIEKAWDAIARKRGWFISPEKLNSPLMPLQFQKEIENQQLTDALDQYKVLLEKYHTLFSNCKNAYANYQQEKFQCVKTLETNETTRNKNLKNINEQYEKDLKELEVAAQTSVEKLNKLKKVQSLFFANPASPRSDSPSAPSKPNTP